MKTKIHTTPIDDSFEEMLISAVRYALGRRTYIVSATVQYVKSHLPKLSDRTLQILERDIRQQPDYGDESIDKPEWMRILNDLQTVMTTRDIKPL